MKCNYSPPLLGIFKTIVLTKLHPWKHHSFNRGQAAVMKECVLSHLIEVMWSVSDAFQATDGHHITSVNWNKVQSVPMNQHQKPRTLAKSLTNFLVYHAQLSITLHLLRLRHGVHLEDIVVAHSPVSAGGPPVTSSPIRKSWSRMLQSHWWADPSPAHSRFISQHRLSRIKFESSCDLREWKSDGWGWRRRRKRRRVFVLFSHIWQARLRPPSHSLNCVAL